MLLQEKAAAAAAARVPLPQVVEEVPTWEPGPHQVKRNERIQTEKKGDWRQPCVLFFFFSLNW